MTQILLKAKNIKKYFHLKKGILSVETGHQLKAVDGINFSVFEGDTFSIVGESGCGKTTTLNLILLLERLTGGQIFFQGKDIAKYSSSEIKKYRKNVQAMFQDPYSSLNPRMRIHKIISEPIEANMDLSKNEIRNHVNLILSEVGLSRQSGDLYPHEFSGGQRQRIAIARALAINPKMVLLDEPVSALDVSVRAQLMNLLKDIQQKKEVTYIIIAHDLANVRYLSSRIMVMYLGKTVESGNSESVFTKRLHPYTKALFSSALPSHPNQRREMNALQGEIPAPINPPPGCRYHTRCPYTKEICRTENPLLEEADLEHMVACHFWQKIIVNGGQDESTNPGWIR